MAKIKPHETFFYMTPDEVAECWDEVSLEMCGILYRKGVAAIEEMTKDIDKADGWCPTSWSSEFNLAKVWDLFSDEEKMYLNEAAQAREGDA